MRHTFLAIALTLAPLCTAGEPDEAENLDAALAALFDDTVALAQLTEASGDVRGAARLYEDARRLRDDDAYVLQQLTRLYGRTEDHRKLLGVYKALVRQQPTSIMWIRQLGSCHFRLGETKEAEAAWRRLLDVYPQRSGALRYLGSIYTQHKLYDKAIATYHEAIALSPENPDLRVSLAQAQNAAGDPLSALATVSGIRNASSSYRERRINAVRSEAVAALDLTPAVQQALQTKLAEGPISTVDLAWFLATLCQERGQARDAVRFYRRVAKREPKSERGRRAADRAAALDPAKKD
jgi:tetratricopeptide (TPR) repeat protein